MAVAANLWAKTETAPSVSPYLYKKLTQVEKLIGQKAYSRAVQTLKNLSGDVEGYEQAVVLRSLSSVYALQEKYSQAAKFLDQALKLKAFPDKQAFQARLNLAQLYMATNQYSRAIKTLEPWLTRHQSLDTETHAMLANAYAQLKQYRKALPHIQQAIRQNKKPPEAWYQLNLALYYELNQYQAAARLLEKLLYHYPDKKDYWSQLASVYQQLRQYPKAVSIKYLMYKTQQLNSEKEILDLVNLFIYAGAPYKGGRILQQSFKSGKVRQTSKNWETLANAWRQAREADLALVALSKASALSGKGQLYLQLAQIYIEKEDWSKAINAAQKALQKGGLRNPGQAYVLLGISHYEREHYPKAIKAFQSAARYKQQKKMARQWLQFLRTH
jgi:tetratricopeptide (TPR) repeat protein